MTKTTVNENGTDSPLNRILNAEVELPLKRMLFEAGIKQKHIAKKANVSPAAVSLVVNGKSTSKWITDVIHKEVHESKLPKTNKG